MRVAIGSSLAESVVRGRSLRSLIKAATRIGGVDGINITVDPAGKIREVSVRASAIERLATSEPGNISKLAASQLELSNNYYESVLKQARRSFLAAVVAATAGVALFLIGVAILEFRPHGGNAATLSAVGGGMVETVAGLNFWLFGKAAAQLDAFHLRLDRIQTFLLANSVCENIGDDTQSSVRADLVRMMAGGKPIPRPKNSANEQSKESRPARRQNEPTNQNGEASMRAPTSETAH